ncbi:MAG: 2-amino-4-hydroxy-6-hydroxymethyldihydropteridine diphosphokinase [Solirubrobacterales bacterium]
MDRIRIKNLNIYGFHGVNSQEKDMGQIFIISIDAYMDLRKAGFSDNLYDTVSYADLCVEVENEFKKNKYDLIEKAAEELATYILTKYDLIKKVSIEIKKPWAPIGKTLEYASVKINRGWHNAFIALGSNLGDKNSNINRAIECIKESVDCKLVSVSELYETEPVGYLDQDTFLNGALEIETLLSPEELIERLMEIEASLKRERIIKWGPRTIDLDILFYDNIISYNEKVILPHPRLQERAFVLKPMCDIAPYFIHPVLKKSMIELLNNLDKQ